MEFLHSLGIEIPGLITQIVGFVILVLLAARFGFPPLFRAIDQRQADIKTMYDKLDADRDSMEDTRRQYEQRLAGIEAEAREKINAAVKEAQELGANLIADAQKQADALIERGRNESERDRQKAFLEMRQQVVALAVTAAGKVIGEALNDDRHARLVDDFIASVDTGAVLNGPRGVSTGVQSGTVGMQNGTASGQGAA